MSETPPQTTPGPAPANPPEPPKLGWLAKFKSSTPVEDKIKLRRSRVRMLVTYGAAWFLFGGGALFVGYLAWYPVTPVPDGQVDNLATAKESFSSLFLATSIVTYWFAASEEPPQNGGGQGPITMMPGINQSICISSQSQKVMDESPKTMKGGFEDMLPP